MAAWYAGAWGNASEMFQVATRRYRTKISYFAEPSVYKIQVSEFGSIRLLVNLLFSVENSNSRKEKMLSFLNVIKALGALV